MTVQIGDQVWFTSKFGDRVTGIYERNKATGQIGFVVQNCDLAVGDLAIWQMSLDDAKE